jgi:hypothetical protein
MSDNLVLEIEVPGFNTDGIAESCESESEPDAPYTVFDYLLDADLMNCECALGIGVPNLGVVAHSGLVVGARIKSPKGSGEDG